MIDIKLISKILKALGYVNHKKMWNQTTRISQLYLMAIKHPEIAFSMSLRSTIFLLESIFTLSLIVLRHIQTYQLLEQKRHQSLLIYLIELLLFHYMLIYL